MLLPLHSFLNLKPGARSQLILQSCEGYDGQADDVGEDAHVAEGEEPEGLGQVAAEGRRERSERTKIR